jgi:tRNA nucleotidyltransferase (CCA-adding enzyme)
MAPWNHLHHIADIGVRGSGKTLEEAFEQAALALTAVITEPRGVRSVEEVELECESSDLELLFVDWLNALIYEMATRKMLFGQFKVQIEGDKLTAKAWGERVDVARHAPAVEVKGATYTALRVGHEAGGEWFAECVVDV